MPDTPRSPGRPTLPEHLRRTVKVTVRLTPDEHAHLESLAAARGQFLPAYMRRAVGLAT